MRLAVGTVVVAVAVTVTTTAAAAPSPPPTAGLTLARFDNTALTGVPLSTEVIGSVEAVPAGGSQPSSLLLTGRLAPPSPGRYGFNITFDPPLAFPSPLAYARVWVDDLQLYPRNTAAVSPLASAVAPLWLPFPPRAVDRHGEVLPAPGATPLGSYEIRLEYVCLAEGGCGNQTFSVRWASTFNPDGAPPAGGYHPIPPSALVPTQAPAEASRRAAAAERERGWGTWDHRSSLTWALLPEGFAVALGLTRRSTAAVLLGNITVQTDHPSVADPIIDPVLRVGPHSLDSAYTELTLSWTGGGPDAINISLRTTAGNAADRATRTGHATSTEALGSSPPLTLSITVNNPTEVNVSDFAVLLCPTFSFGRGGRVSADSRGVGGTGYGLRATRLNLVAGAALPPQPQLGDSTHLAVTLGGGPVAVSTDPADTGGSVKAKTEVARVKEAQTLDKYGESWRDVKDAVQTSLMWSLMYDPKRSLFAPSYAYSGNSSFSAYTVDGDVNEVIFEWDQSFAGYMFGLDSADLALSHLIAVVKAKTAAGFVPGMSDGTFKTRTSTQPPVTSKALREVVRRWGLARTRWAVELCVDDLYNWNTWMFTQRREVPFGLLTCGASAYNTYAPDGTAAASNPPGQWGDSGLDNGPTVEGLPFNQTGLWLQDQYSSGFTGMFLMDCLAQAELAELINRTEIAAELRRRAAVVNTAMMAHLWNSSTSAFQNVLSTPYQPVDRVAPTHFYPLLAGPEYGPSEVVAAETIRRVLTNRTKFAVWPSAAAPPDLPPEDARPLVQWQSAICGDKGFRCPDSPHALCCQLRCNYRFAFGNFVQRTHGKVRYEGMALSRPVPSAELGIGHNTSLTPLFEYNCTAPGANASDYTLGPADWAGSVASGGGSVPCRRTAATAEAYVLPARVGPAMASLVELEVWHRPGDHYVVASAAGKAEAEASGYVRVQSLGYVWPPPGSPTAPSRYGLPSIAKDDPTYISQDYWRGRVWSPMLQLVFWGISQYTSPEAKGATAGLVAQSKALLLKEWQGYPSDNNYSGTGRRVYENYGADTAEGWAYSSPAAPLYAWGALSGFIGLVAEGFYDPVPVRSS